MVGKKKGQLLRLLLCFCLLLVSVFTPRSLEKQTIQAWDGGIVQNAKPRPIVSDVLHERQRPLVLGAEKKGSLQEEHKLSMGSEGAMLLSGRKQETALILHRWTGSYGEAFGAVLPLLWYIQKQDGL